MSGAPGAAALAPAVALLAAALLLAPEAARAETECGIANQAIITCGNAAYNDGIQYFNTNTIGFGNGTTVNVPGRSSGPTTITAGASQSTGIKLKVTTRQGATLNVGGATGGTAHVVNIVQGTNTRTSDAYNHGIHFMQNRLESWATVNVKAGVTIGSSSAPMKQRGIFLHWRSDQISQGRGAGSARFTSAATIYARRQGIHFVRENGGTNDETTLTNTGAIFSGVNNPSATGAYFDRPHGIHVLYGGTQMTGTLSVTNSGAITVGGAYTGIVMRHWGVGAMSLDNSGDIGAVAGQTARQGIQFNFEYWDNQSAQAVTLTNSGAITASEFGIRLKKLSGGAVTLTNRGAVTATAEAAQHLGHAIYLAEGVTFGDGRTYAANSGAITVDNSGALRSKNHALYVYLATADDDVELENSGAVTSEDGDGIRIERTAEGDVEVTNSGSVSGRWHGIYVGKAARVDFDQSGGTIAGRTGVYLQVTRESASGDTRSTDSGGDHDPAIDIDWTGGSIARGTAADDMGRFRAASAVQALSFDQEAAAVKAMEGTLHYGGAAGIEAHALSWRDVVAQVAKGDDPGAIADNAAQLVAVPTGATAADNAYVAQLRAALGNADLTVAAAVLTAIDSTATSLADVTDAEIVAYLQTDNGATRTLLRDILAQGLTDGEKAILRAVATNDGVDAALTAAGFSDDTSDPNDYWSLVKALLDRHNVDDVSVSMTGGSIDTRGDGIRAYYATPNDDNGGIDVTIGAGVRVTAGGAGVYVANAGRDGTVANSGTITAGADGIYVVNANDAVTVTNSGTIRGGTYGVRVVKSGTSGDVILTTTGGSITADTLAGVHLQDNAGHTGDVTVTNAGGVTGGTWGIYANRLGSGDLSVTSTGGTVVGMTEAGIFAANKAADASDLPVEVSGGAVRSEGRSKAAVHAWNRGTGDVTVTIASGVGVSSKHGAGVFADLGSAYSTTSELEVTQGGAVQGRTGVYARAAHGDDAATPTARGAGAQPMIDVTWTGTFSHGTAATVAQSDDGRFAAATAAQVLAFDQEAAAGKALDESLRYGGAAGIEAHALSWRDVVAQVAKGDDPGAIADDTAQANLLSTTHADSRRAAILAQLRAALGNDEVEVAAAVLTAIDSTAASVDDLSDAEIVAYLSTDDDATRALLRNVLALGLSDKEKAVLRAAAANEGLATALADADAAFSAAYRTAVNALLDQYNVGDVRVAMNGGSIRAARGDGIRAYYATSNDNNGGIEVTVAAGAVVTGGKAGVHVANAGTGLQVAKKYTYAFGMGDGATADDLVAASYNSVALRDQLVTVSGTVTGGTDAGVRLGGGAVIVTEDGEVRAGSSGVGVLADGAALVYVDGEVRGGAGGAAAVHLEGGGTVTVGLNGRIQANGATHAIQSDGAGTTRLTLVTDRQIPYWDVLTAQVEGSLSGVDSVRIRQYQNGVPTGYSLPVTVTSAGLLDLSKLPSRPKSFDCSADGPCRIARTGTISGRTGVYAAVPSASTTAAAQPPLIAVDWRAAFTHAAGSAEVRSAPDALVSDREASAGAALAGSVHYGGPAGIEAHALSWRDVAAQVAKGDDPGAVADASAQTAMLATSGAASRRTAILAQFRAALGNADLAVASSVLTAIDSTATSVSDLSDAEIVAYLGTDDVPTRALLRNVLAQGLSEKEKAVLRAVAVGDGDGLTTALDDVDAAFSAAYKTAVRALLDLYNAGDIDVAVNGGSIDSEGDGVRAYYATPHESNGGISVTVAQGASVTGDKAGVYVANAGEGLRIPKRYAPEAIRMLPVNENAGEDDLIAIGVLNEAGDAIETPYLNQLVTIAGTVTGGTDAAVHLSGGGMVLVLEGGEVRAGASGVGVLVNDPGPALVFIDGEVKGAEGGAAAVHLTGGGAVTVGLNGRVLANGADYAIQGAEDAKVRVALATTGLYREDVAAALARVEGGHQGENVAAEDRVPGGYKNVENVVRFPWYRNNANTGYFIPLEFNEDGLLDTNQVPLRPTLSCGTAEGRRCRMYEALPSMLLALNALPSRAERASAPRDARGGWARVEASRGEWRAKKARTAAKLAYDYSWVVARAGMDFAPREDLRVGFSMHAPRGKAEMAGVGEVELDGVGAGVSAAWRSGDFYVDAQAAATRYDVDFESYTQGKLLKKDASGVGYALGAEAGRRMPVGGTFVTPRAGLSWSKVNMDEFTDLEMADQPGLSRVSVEDAGSVKGRLGVTVEKEVGTGAAPGLLFGSLDVEHEFSDETEVKVGGQMLKAEAQPTALSLGAGAVFDVRENVLMRAAAGYRASEGGASGYSGSLEVQVRF